MNFGLLLEILGLPWWLNGKESACQAGYIDSVPGSGRSPGGGNGNPLQYPCLENPMDREVWWATVHRDMTEHSCTYILLTSIYYRHKMIEYSL